VTTLLAGIVLLLIVSFMVGLVLPTDLVNAQMRSFSTPRLLDMVVALAAGIVGSYATARKDIPEALAGVAVALSLEPSLCNFGLEMANGDGDVALRAGLLFLTNLVAIVTGGSLVWA
jgi:uncharacterized hydrophobic protein (TIGR00271 family)